MNTESQSDTGHKASEALESVTFFVMNGRHDNIMFDIAQLEYGKLVHIKDDVGFVLKKEPFQGSRPAGIFRYGRNSSGFHINLFDYYPIEDWDYTNLAMLKGYISQEEVEPLLKALAAKIRLEKLYDGKELNNSALGTIRAVFDRLKTVAVLMNPDVSMKLGNYWDPMVHYHLLTCFDLLGQPGEWVDFDEWLRSRIKRNELSDPRLNENEAPHSALDLFAKYKGDYGVRRSFDKFITDVLPESDRLRLFSSFQIHVHESHPEHKTIHEDVDDRQKMKFLFDLRNSYTHKAKVFPGANMEEIWKDSPREHRISYRETWHFRFQERKVHTYYSYQTMNWPYAIIETVKAGAAAYIRQQAK